MRVALFGGSFNPIHVGHLMVTTWVVATDRADECWIVPTFRHPFGKELAPFADRVAMARASVEGFPRLRVSEIEAERAGPSFTIDTVEALRARNPATRFLLVVGSDVLGESPKWREWDRLKTLVELLPVRRAGVALPAEGEGPLFPEVSSSEIRSRIGRGEDVSALVPAPALALIREKHLYR